MRGLGLWRIFRLYQDQAGSPVSGGPMAGSRGGPRGAEGQPGDSSGPGHIPMELKGVGGGEADGQPR